MVTFAGMSAPTNMKVTKYYPPGGPDKLMYENQEVPTPSKGEVLIKVHAAGLIWTELTWPIYQDKLGNLIPHIPAHDFAGVIEVLGPECENHKFQIGTEVYGFTSRRNHQGALAEYVLADEDQVVLKPSNISLIEAAAVPLSALTAWQAIHEHVGLQHGQTLLVTGGAGGTGIFAVPIAKHLGARVIATASDPKSKQMLQALNVDEIIDYKHTELIEAVSDVDAVLDCVGGAVFDQALKVVKPAGVVVSICVWGAEAQAEAVGRKGKFFIVRMDQGQLDQITTAIENGLMRPKIDSVYSLERSREAFEYAAEGHVHGKVVITPHE